MELLGKKETNKYKSCKRISGFYINFDTEETLSLHLHITYPWTTL